MAYANDRHEITVHKLKELLLQLKDDDVLVPNRVQNLAILRDGEYVGAINLGRSESVEFVEGDAAPS